MMRALWTAASGMKSQQLNIDTISNNLANVNTTGYKKQRLEFKDLLYENIKKANIIEGQGSPSNLQIGHGVMPSATSRIFENGTPDRTDNPTDFALDGQGFFAIETPSGERLYTRDGSFKLSVDEDTKKLVTSEGYTVLTEDDEEIVIEDGYTDFTIDQDGNISVKNEDGEVEELGKIKIVNFLNPDGLEAVGRNFFKATNASGEEIVLEDENRNTKVFQGFLESSNVQIVDEMIKMITAQRAYEINSKAIQTADDMLQMANNLKR
ncbi:flagellar basal-body rod protein FlgG [Tepidibacter thalassicus]|uniref:Flagellar basal-body rod protein FlgG n=1 Tax=Tepidibacter thalassicus DSM 15285 TaxID=1123350 RepID=A0A1M5R1P8_9FIRM|nr:flagellar basal-body rod protein FlgG [Tepidibacter thalassicus]SHH19703.1 flagellar basal-body rod protein FlgG [Tepidibacter thalassicus DSM 15285]